MALLWFTLLCLVHAVHAAPPAAGPAVPDGFTPLFDGQSPEGWTGAIGSYTFNGGVIRCKADQGGAIFTEKTYHDFVVRLEFKLPPAGNNGLAIRYPGHGDPAYSGMCELQVLDNAHPRYQELDPRQYHGSAYGIAAAQRGHLKPVGEWNRQTVTVIGSTIKVELNGQIILDADLADTTDYFQNKPHPGKNRPSGHFGFAGHGQPVAFRHIYIKELTP